MQRIFKCRSVVLRVSCHFYATRIRASSVSQRTPAAAMTDKQPPFFSCRPDAAVQLTLVHMLPSAICAHGCMTACGTPCRQTGFTTNTHRHTHTQTCIVSCTTCVASQLISRYSCRARRQRIKVSSPGLSANRPSPKFISRDTKERLVNAAPVNVPGHTDNILGMSRKLRRPIMASQLHFKRG